VRFFCIGSFNAALDFTILNVMVSLVKAPTLLANTVSVSISITVSYFLNHRIVFRHRERRNLKNYLHFFAVTGFSALAIQNLVIGAITHLAKVPATRVAHIASFNLPARTLELNLAKVVAVAIGMVWNYLLYKYVVFKHDETNELLLA